MREIWISYEEPASGLVDGLDLVRAGENDENLRGHCDCRFG